MRGIQLAHVQKSCFFPLRFVRFGDVTNEQYELWRTVYSGFEIDENRLSPRAAGEYTWPMEGATGYYGIFIAGPTPPLECKLRAPAGTKLVGCFADSKRNRLLNSDSLIINYRGTGGMTPQVITKLFLMAVVAGPMYL